LPALREIGFQANRRLLRVQTISHDPIVGIDALHAITDPVTTPAGTRITGLRIGEQRSHALLTAMPMFTLQTNGFRNRDLRLLIAQLRGLDPDTVTAGQMTYDLRRLKRHGLIDKIPHTHLPGHRPRPVRLDVPVRGPRPTATHRPGRPAHPVSGTDPHRHPQLSTGRRGPHPHNRSSSMTAQPRSEHPKLDSKLRLRRL